MLIAIFFLLLIVFFPLLSLILGVGFLVVLVKFWWVFLILTGCLIFCGYIDRKEAKAKAEAKFQRQQEAIIGAIRGGQADKSSNLTKPSYKGEPELSNDSYILYLAKKYEIERNDLLGKYVLNEKLYNTIDDALKVCADSELLEQKQNEDYLQHQAIKTKETAKAHQEMILARKSNIKRLLVFLGLIFVGVLVYWMVYQRNAPYKSAYSRADESSCTAVAKTTVEQTDGYGKKIKSCFRVKDSLNGDDLGEMCPETLNVGDYFYPKSTYSDKDFCTPIRNLVERCYPKNSFTLYGACADSDLRQFKE